MSKLPFHPWKTNKTAVVTGASAGIGAAIVRRLVSEGLTVFGMDRNLAALKALGIEFITLECLYRNGNFHPLVTDMSNEQEIMQQMSEIRESYGHISILINNAGVLDNFPLLSGVTENWQNAFNTIILGLEIASRETVKIMQAFNEPGYIININSTVGNVDSMTEMIYKATKYAVTELTESFRRVLAQIGCETIRISCINPGVVTFKKPLDSTEDEVPHLYVSDIVNAVIFILSTAPRVQVQDIVIKPLFH